MLLRVGMTKKEILLTLGKPTLIEMDEAMEWWLYLTNFSSYNTHTGKYVPVVFKDGKLIGWGPNYWSSLERSDEKVGQTIEQD